MTKRNAKAELTEAEEPTIFTPKEVAAQLGTDPKTFRRFLRTLTADRAGKGGRWKLDADTVDTISAAWEARLTKGTTPDLDDDLETLEG